MAKKERKDKKEKPLEKMTATELRKYALELGEIHGVHGMNKEELLAAIKKVKGIVDEGKKKEKPVTVRELKKKIKELKALPPHQPLKEAHPQGGLGGVFSFPFSVKRRVLTPKRGWGGGLAIPRSSPHSSKKWGRFVNLPLFI